MALEGSKHEDPDISVKKSEVSLFHSPSLEVVLNNFWHILMVLNDLKTHSDSRGEDYTVICEEN